MLISAHPDKTPTRDIAHDDADPPSSDLVVPVIETAGIGRLGRALVGCLVVEAILVAIAVAVLVGGTVTPQAGPLPDRAHESSTESSAPDDRAAFLSSWRRSLEQDHVASGTLTRTVLGRGGLFSSNWPDATDAQGLATTVLPYRSSRLDGRALTQIGDAATIVHPVEGRRICLRQTNGFACTVDDDPGVDATVAVRQAVEGPTATHRIVAVDSTDVLTEFPRLPPDIRCWEARSLTDGMDQRWGRRAQFCFHNPSGAAVFRRVLGATRIEVLIVESVSQSVTPTDLDPA